MKLHLGAGKFPKPKDEGWINLDQCELPGIDLVFDLDKCRTERLPLEDNSVDEFFGSHVLEHIHDVLPLMQELYRVAKPDAKCVFRVPYGSSDDAWENPTHVRPYFIGSFVAFSQPYYWREDYGYKGDWKIENVQLLIPDYLLDQLGNDRQRVEGAVRTLRNVVAEMVVTLSAVKPIRANERNLQTPIVIDIVRTITE